MSSVFFCFFLRQCSDIYISDWSVCFSLLLCCVCTIGVHWYSLSFLFFSTGAAVPSLDNTTHTAVNFGGGGQVTCSNCNNCMANYSLLEYDWVSLNDSEFSAVKSAWCKKRGKKQRLSELYVVRLPQHTPYPNNSCVSEVN